MKMYEAAPGHWLVEGVTLEQNRAAWAANYVGDIDDDLVIRATLGRCPSDRLRIWVTKTRERIAYQDLTDGHLENIVAMLEWSGLSLAESYPNLLAERERRQGAGAAR